MTNQPSKKQKKQEDGKVEPLKSREIFLDTQVYRALSHNTANRALTLLKERIDQHRVVLHTSDITYMEIARQIRERVLARQRELAAIEKDLSRWRIAAPKFSKPKFEIAADEIAAELFTNLRMFLQIECSATAHQALKLKPEVIFRKYFERDAPFDGEDSKEFPDAFVIEALLQWCKKQNKKMYVVTEDKAFLRAVEASDRLLPLKNINELLIRSAADLGQEGENAAEEALNGPDFDGSFEDALQDEISQITFVYVGDLDEGEAYEGSLVLVEEITDWSPVNMNEQTIDLIVNAKLYVSVEVQYEDRDDAIYDKEDHQWFGAETTSTQVENEINIQVIVEIERGNGKVRSAKILTQEALIR